MRWNCNPVRSLSWSVTRMNAISVLLGRQKGVRLSDSQSTSASASSFFSSSPSVGLVLRALRAPRHDIGRLQYCDSQTAPSYSLLVGAAQPAVCDSHDREVKV